jgi:6-phospho-3-hexuloisomerase
VAERVRECVERIDEAESAALLAAVASGRRGFVLGAGRSGLVGQAFAMRLRQMGLPAFVVGSPTCLSIGTGDLLLLVSGSGGRPTHRELVRAAKAAGATLALVTAERRAALAGEAELVVRIPSIGAGDETALNRLPHQPLNTLFEQALLVFLDALVVELMERLKVPAALMRSRHSNLE